MGITALAAAALQSAPPLAQHWFWIWLAAAAVAIALVTFFLVSKTRKQGLSLLRGVGRRFFLALLPPWRRRRPHCGVVRGRRPLAS